MWGLWCSVATRAQSAGGCAFASRSEGSGELRVDWGAFLATVPRWAQDDDEEREEIIWGLTECRRMISLSPMSALMDDPELADD